MVNENGRKILVVDDDGQILEVLPPILANGGYRAVTATGAGEAIRRLEADDEVAVVLTDVRLPTTSGIELMESIHRLRPELPVILMTAYADLEMTEQAIRNRAFDFITKPIRPASLLRSLEKAVTHVTLLELERNYREMLEEAVGEKTRELRRQHEELQTLFLLVESIKKQWERTMDCIGDIVILADAEGRIRRCNRALRDFTGTDYARILGNPWQPFLGRHGLVIPSPCPPGTEIFHEPSGRWFICASYPFRDTPGEAVTGLVITIVDGTELKRTAEELARAYRELQTTQAQMIQREKMASIGQLTAGVAHEINNPVGYISSNLTTLGKYAERLTLFVRRQSELCAPLVTPAVRAELEKSRGELKIDRIMQDISQLIAESQDGAARVRRIVRDMKTFSRSDEGEYKTADIVECLESAISIAWNELKYKATLTRNYGAIPPVRCYPQQLNQVFMNILVNAAHAIDNQGEIVIDTRLENGEVLVSITDTGCGIPAENLGRIFEPFFTTKEVGTGTGLGLSISYDIIKKHHGEITVRSEAGKGTTFTVKIPAT